MSAFDRSPSRPTVRRTAGRLALCRYLGTHGPSSHFPDLTPWPTTAALSSLLQAKFIRSRVIKGGVDKRGQKTQALELRLTPAGRQWLETTSAPSVTQASRTVRS